MIKAKQTKQQPGEDHSEFEWTKSRPGLWTRLGWFITQCNVQDSSGRANAVLYRVYRPGQRTHVSSFTLLGRAQWWADHVGMLESKGGKAASK